MMSKVALVTVSDDRSGRKNGKYSETQDRIRTLFEQHVNFGITDLFLWKWEDIIKTNFYLENKKILDHMDPAMNGRCYKPFVIKEALEKLAAGASLVQLYTGFIYEGPALIADIKKALIKRA